MTEDQAEDHTPTSSTATLEETFFSDLPHPKVKLLEVAKAYAEDQNSMKLNLMFSPYATVDLEASLLPVVSKVTRQLLSDTTLPRNVTPPWGDPLFCELAVRLILGDTSPAVIEGRAFGLQTPTGANSIRVAAEFLHTLLEMDHFCYPYFIESYKLFFESAGFKNAHPLKYLDQQGRIFSMHNFTESLMKVPDNSAIILFTCGYYITRVDPTKSEWAAIADIIKSKHLFPVFDCAYQGLASGSLDEDAWPVRHFVEQGFELFGCQSFIGNFGINLDPVGNLLIVVENPDQIIPIKMQFLYIFKGLFGKPAGRGSKVVAYILNNPDLYQHWQYNIRIMSNRIDRMKRELRSILELLGTPGKWNFFTKQVGMFLCTGLTVEQCERMATKHHIYMQLAGRINMSSVTLENVGRIGKAIDEVVRFSCGLESGISNCSSRITTLMMTRSRINFNLHI